MRINTNFYTNHHIRRHHGILRQLSSSSTSSLSIVQESSVTQVAEDLGLVSPGTTTRSTVDFVGGHAANAVYIDCRSEEEQATGIVPGSINLPYPHNGDDEIINPDEWLQDLVEEVFDGEEVSDPTSVPIYVGCRKGPRSVMACEVLRKAGYTNVTNVRGGMMAWFKAGLPMDIYQG